MPVHLMEISSLPACYWAASKSCLDVVMVVVFNGKWCVRVNGSGSDRDGKLEGRLGDIC